MKVNLGGAMGWIDALGYLGALIALGTKSMKAMIALRVQVDSHSGHHAG